MRFLTVLCAIIVVATASYDGFKVYRVKPSNYDQVALVAKFKDNNNFDFWSPLAYNANPVDVMVAPEAQNHFVRFLQNHGINYEMIINNVELVVQQERVRQMISPRTTTGRISFIKYNTYKEVSAYLDQLGKDYSDIVTVESIGESYEGRNMKIIQISTDPSANKPVVFIDAGIHAREWIAPAQAVYIIQELVQNPSNRHLLDNVDWHILPVFNVDGYEYTHVSSKNRMWRKTVSPQGPCVGTDGNRNFDYYWGLTGASSDPCNDTFKGPVAFSEIETQNVRDYILKHKEQIKLYLTFHSYGNYLLYPWGYTSELPEDDAELRALAEDVNNAIVQAGGDDYTIGTSTNVLYAAAGGSDDWAKGVAGIQLSYTIELPGGGWSGFDPPASQIVPIVTETFEGVKVYGDYIAKKFGN